MVKKTTVLPIRTRAHAPAWICIQNCAIRMGDKEAQLELLRTTGSRSGDRAKTMGKPYAEMTIPAVKKSAKSLGVVELLLEKVSL